MPDKISFITADGIWVLYTRLEFEENVSKEPVFWHIDDPKPPGPVELEENVPGTLSVSWSPSPDEKRDDRLYYIVANRDSVKQTWNTVADRVFNNNITAVNIMPGREYVFRVYAKNDIGLSAPSESPVWKVVMKKGKVYFLYLFDWGKECFKGTLGNFLAHYTTISCFY